MKHIICFLILTISTVGLFAQQDTVFIKKSKDSTSDTLIYETDTIIFNSSLTRNILFGTTVLPWTHNQLNAMNFGLHFEKVTKSDCQSHGEEVYSAKDKINYIEITDTTLIIDVNIYDNCCYDFLCDISVDSTGTLSLIYHGYGTFCACYCCFGLTFHFSRTKSPENEEIKAVVLGEDKRTFKKLVE